jgi:hypothetical protein
MQRMACGDKHSFAVIVAGRGWRISNHLAEHWRREETLLV